MWPLEDRKKLRAAKRGITRLERSPDADAPDAAVQKRIDADAAQAARAAEMAALKKSKKSSKPDNPAIKPAATAGSW